MQKAQLCKLKGVKVGLSNGFMIRLSVCSSVEDDTPTLKGPIGINFQEVIAMWQTTDGKYRVIGYTVLPGS